MTRITPEARGVWRLRCTLTKKAVSSTDNRVFIPSFDTGKSYEAEYLAVGVKAANSKDSWRQGGYLAQEFTVPITGYSTRNRAFNRTPDLLINDVTIIKVPLLTQSEYRLRYFAPTYFSDVRLQIWEYSGVRTDLLLRDLADFFRNASPDLLINLPLIEEKLDLLLANQQSGLAVDLSSLESKLDRLLACCKCAPEPPEQDEADTYLLLKFLGFI